MVGILLSYWGGLFSGAMLVSGRVVLSFFGGGGGVCGLAVSFQGGEVNGLPVGGFNQPNSKNMSEIESFPHKSG